MRTITHTLVVAGLALAAASQAQYRQLYDQPLGSHVSTVVSCMHPLPMPQAAADDFRFQDNYVVNHFRWWGTVSGLQQLNRVYYIAIYEDAGCRPGKILFQRCLTPQAVAVAVDCTGRVVYRFTASLAAPLNVPAGHYWFRVAESDADSVTIGSVDFQWSAARPIRGCDAGWHDLAGWNSPLIDPCDGKKEDLAFCLLG